MFLEQAQEMIELLQQNTSPDKKDVWKSAAHRFKGSSGNLGANHLHHLCKRAEIHFEDSENKKLEMLDHIKIETKRVQEFFRSGIRKWYD
jgi:HPt (histidine-containing phosphotransfer) domain-containing protein